MKTVLMTGCSSGFGLETARYFLERDWQVVATMRTPRDDLLPPSSRLRVLRLDVTDSQNIGEAVAAVGPIDVLVNNAGFGAPAPFELTSMETVRALFETNTFGTIAVTQAVLPIMRDRRSGVVVNVTSSVTLKPLPLVGQPATRESFAKAAGIVLKDAKGYAHNEFKIELARRAIVRGLEQAAAGTPQSQADKRIQ